MSDGREDVERARLGMGEDETSIILLYGHRCRERDLWLRVCYVARPNETITFAAHSLDSTLFPVRLS